MKHATMKNKTKPPKANTVFYCFQSNPEGSGDDMREADILLLMTREDGFRALKQLAESLAQADAKILIRLYSGKMTSRTLSENDDPQTNSQAGSTQAESPIE